MMVLFQYSVLLLFNGFHYSQIYSSGQYWYSLLTDIPIIYSSDYYSIYYCIHCLFIDIQYSIYSQWLFIVCPQWYSVTINDYSIIQYSIDIIHYYSIINYSILLFSVYYWLLCWWWWFHYSVTHCPMMCVLFIIVIFIDDSIDYSIIPMSNSDYSQ